MNWPAVFDTAPTATAYIYERRMERVVGAACAGALLVPTLSRLLLSFNAVRVLKAHTGVPVLLPTHALGGGAIGAVAGWLEDRTVRIAYEETLRARRNVEVPLWTHRSLLPCLVFYVNPLACRKCLDGEQKGTDVAMAQLCGHRFRAWPYFTVDLPEDLTQDATGRSESSGGMTMVLPLEVRKLLRRTWDGNYDVDEDEGGEGDRVGLKPEEGGGGVAVEDHSGSTRAPR